MKKIYYVKYNNIFSTFLIFLAIFSYFIGFIIDEVPMGSGGYNGDFEFVKKSIKLFSENSIKEAIILFGESSNRPPLIYILHKFLNPYFVNEEYFRTSVFIISLFTPFLFYLCLRERFPNSERLMLLTISSVLFLNPFFRNSSFWGLEENYAIIAALCSLFFLIKFTKSQKNEIFQVFFIIFFSSLSIYFDQKFLVIPLICFFKIILENFRLSTKIITIILYSLFSIPYLYLIYIWGGIFPSNIYDVGGQFFFNHFGFSLTILAFIFFPFFIFKSDQIIKRVSIFLKDPRIYVFLVIIIFYLTIIVFFFNDFHKVNGGGVIKKILVLIFNNEIYEKIFLILSFFISWFLILFFIEKKKINFLLITYFVFISLIITPFYQEYFDPIIFLLVFLIFKIDFKFTYKKVFYFYLYFLSFLICVNYYYSNILIL